MSKNEDNYFSQAEMDKLHSERRIRQMEVLRKEEAEGIAQELATSEEVAKEALDLGFDAATAVILPLVPLLEVAWADGKMEERESKTIMEAATSRNIKHPDAVSFLQLMVDKRPSALFFKRVNNLLAHITESDPNNPTVQGVLEQCKAVAEAAGGFFGLTDPIGSEERKALEDLAKILDVG